MKWRWALFSLSNYNTIIANDTTKLFVGYFVVVAGKFFGLNYYRTSKLINSCVIQTRINQFCFLSHAAFCKIICTQGLQSFYRASGIRSFLKSFLYFLPHVSHFQAVKKGIPRSRHECYGPCDVICSFYVCCKAVH